VRILLTGTSGQVGGALQPRLAAAGHDVVAPRRDAFDLARPHLLAAALDEMAPDLIVNPAAYTAVDQAEDDADLAFLVNRDAPAEIAAWVARRDVPLLHFSTDYVFDGSGSAPWREDSPTAPLSVYGASKLAGERAIAAAGGSHLVIRTSWVYAAGGKNFLRTMARLARERSELRVVDDQVSGPTSASAIADAVIAILAADRARLVTRCRDSSGFVHLACADVTSWHGFATAIVAGLRARDVELAVQRIVPIPTQEFPTRARRPANSRLDLRRLNDVFGIAMPSWQRALAPELDALAREMKGQAARDF
jgi:dTDP-4-dehydrorhamnose reductase